MKTKKNLKTEFLRSFSLEETKNQSENRRFTKTELDAYFSALIFIFEHLNYSKHLPRLKEKHIDRFLMQNNGVYLMEDNKMMLAHLYFLWSKGDGTFSRNKIQGLVVLLLEIMKGFTDEEEQELKALISVLLKE